MTKNNERLRYEDFEAYLPSYDFDENQIQFFKDTFENIKNNRDTSKVTCFSTRCGIGKSTFIHSFMYCCIVDDYWNRQNVRHEPQGLVVVTDSIKRLEELSSNVKDIENARDEWGEVFEEWGIDDNYKKFEKSVIVLKSDEPFVDQLIKQRYKPIVLLSTQRYFMMTDDIREQLFSFTYNKETYKRDIVIFDECPQFSEAVKINSWNLTQIEYALYEGLSDEVKDKKFVTDEFRTFKNRLIDQMDEKEKLSKESNVIIYWKDDRYTTITHNDELFFKVITENIGALTAKYNSFMKDMQCLKEIAKNGAIFNSVKKKHGNYERNFVIVRDNRDSFYLNEDKKFFVFDATADIDPRYDLDYVEVISGEEYNQPLNMSITNVNISSSKNVLCKGNSKAIATTNAIINYIEKKLRQGIKCSKDILIVVYSDLYKKFLKKFQYVGYFGNLKGFNDYKDLHNMAHVGMNRFPNMVYFYIYCGCHMKEYQKLKNMTEEESLKFFNSLSKNHNEEYQQIINSVMLGCMLTDFEQNIFRLAIRNYKNKKHVQIWTFYNRDDALYSNLTKMIEERYSKYGVKIEMEDTPEELQKAKTESRNPAKGKKKTNPQKILNWIENLKPGTVFKVKELLSATGLTNEMLKEARKSNSVVNKIFSEMKTNKKGYYEKK